MARPVSATIGPCLADWGPRSIRIYTSEKRPRLVAVIRTADHGANADDVLRAHGWKRIGPWIHADDMPGGHTCAAVERVEGAA